MSYFQERLISDPFFSDETEKDEGEEEEYSIDSRLLETTEVEIESDTDKEEEDSSENPLSATATIHPFPPTFSFCHNTLQWQNRSNPQHVRQKLF